MINSLYITLKECLVYSIILLLLNEIYFSPDFVSLLLFRIHKWSTNIPNRNHRHSNTGLPFDCLYFPFHGLHFATIHGTTLHFRVLNPVFCFHMTLFNYGAKGVSNADSTCRCHQSNIMSASVFSINITQYVTCG